jgi:hypothetical protein
MERIVPEAFSFRCPLFADERVRRESHEVHEPSAEVVGGNEVVKVLSELGMIVVMIPLDLGFLDRPVHSLDLAIRPWMCRLCQPMIDVEIGTCRIEGLATEENPFCPLRFDVRDRLPVVGRLTVVCAVIRQNGVDLVGKRVSEITGKSAATRRVALL